MTFGDSWETLEKRPSKSRKTGLTLLPTVNPGLRRLGAV